MSLINQVLQDLDRRHAAGAAMPAAVKSAPSPKAPEPAWRLAAIAGAVLLVAAGSAALAWSMAGRMAPQVATAREAAPAVQAAQAPTPVVVVTGPTSSTAAPVAGPSMTTPAAAVAATSANKVALGQPTAVTQNALSKPQTVANSSAKAPRSTAATDSAEAAQGTPAPTALALAPTSAVKPSAFPVAAMGESRIEKRTPGRTAHERAEGEYQRGVALHQAGQYAEAAQAYGMALREEPAHALSRQALAGALINQGKPEEASRVLAEGLTLAPQNTALAMMLARVHADRGDMQSAAQVLQPTNGTWMSAEDHAFRAAVLQRAGRHADASEHFAAAVRSVPDNGVWWMGLAISQAAEGKNDTAREAFSRARAAGNLSPELAQYVEQRLRQL